MLFTPTKQQRGVALIIVLFCLALLVITIVGFLASMEADRHSARGYAAGNESRRLAQMTLEMVQAQIRDATTTGIDDDGVGHHSWASQPGMIRTFSDTGADNVVKAYKLYSAMPMTLSGSGAGINTTSDIPEDWNSRAEEFVDLNEPVRLSDGRRIYPIVNPETSAADQPLGFGVESANIPGSSGNPAPMPVRWLYVMRNGSVGPRSSATPQNPVVGRIAFWADDESCKININTASATTANSYWETPRTFDEKAFNNFAWRAPGQNEYQRFPGHPAMISLAPVFPAVAASAQNLEKLFGITPRYQWGGSRDASVRIKDTRTALPMDKGQRLYASVDEILFSTSRGQNELVTPARVRDAGFFLTASGRASDLNGFGQPRISLWPLHADAAKRTKVDELIALCATAGTGSNALTYSFQRSSPLSSTADATAGRNPGILAYLDGLMDRNLPGYGASFATKYGTPDARQIRTYLFDYLRSGVNLLEAYQDPGGLNVTGFSYTSYPASDPFSSENTTNAGMGFVAPIEIGATRGMGRFPVIVEAGIWIIRTRTDATNPNLFQAALVLETFSPMQGYSPWQPNMQISVRSGANPLTVGGVAVLSTPMNRTQIQSTFKSGGDIIGGLDGIATFCGPTTGYLGRLHTNEDRYPIFSPEFTTTDSTIPAGGDVIIDLKVDGQIVQTYHLTFPSANLPRPGLGEATDNRTNQWKARDISVPLDPTVSDNSTLNRVSRGPRLGFLPQDVVHSIQFTHGDFRLLTAMPTVAASHFTPHPDYGKPQSFAHSFRYGYFQYHHGATFGKYTGATYFDRPSMMLSHRHKISPGVTSLRPLWVGDYDNGLGATIDGPYFNKPDEGNIPATSQPYYSNQWQSAAALYSPTRQIPSAGMFGSIPSAATSNKPWQTLLFSPYPLMGKDHPGFANPPDWGLLDFFHNPVVLPYALSEPFSTAGRVNLNYGMEPFRYIKRATGLHGAMASLQVSTVKDEEAGRYKILYSLPASLGGGLTNTHSPLDVVQTLKQFEARFQKGEIFKNAAEICSVHLVPQGTTLPGEVTEAGTADGAMASFWETREIIGDNTRERPYTVLYPLLTTKSNTFTVHFRVQTLKPESSRDHVTSEYRGSYLLERFLDPGDERLADGSVNPDIQSLEPLYRFRVLQTKPFLPF